MRTNLVSLRYHLCAGPQKARSTRVAHAPDAGLPAGREADHGRSVE
ncbi:hypothetical protein X907_2501 [Glycocaulis alkaliphilus]|uniref:Uncharacterized protein n=1 Tax=Glycocaulis alkaliphilus TaxID=1434191 RepID=A0A3T0ECJ2_9PROT|nr:hypothetical protein X907_2501 [Glycocaulis alkaliphilus]